MDRLYGDTEDVRHAWGQSEGVDSDEIMRNWTSAMMMVNTLGYFYLCIATDVA